MLLEQFADLIEIAVDEEKCIRLRPTATGRLLLEILPEDIGFFRIVDVAIDMLHQVCGFCIAIHADETDIAIGFGEGGVVAA